MKKVLVLAGNAEQFRMFKLEAQRALSEVEFIATQFIYADSIEHIQGQQADNIVLYGTFYEKDNHDKLLKECQLRLKEQK